MATYTSIIGAGAGNDYPTIAAWYEASATYAPVDFYDDGDEVIALLQSSADGHDGYHDLAGTQYDWPEDKEITITFSSTKLAGSGPADGWLRTGDGFNSIVFQSSAASKTINFKNLDIQMHEGTIAINRDLAGLVDNAPTQVNYDRCRISGLDQNKDFNFAGSKAGYATSGVVTYTFTNSLIRTRTIVRQENNDFSKVVCNLIGCVLSNNGSQAWFYPNGNTTGPGNSTYEAHFSGVVANWARQPPSTFNGIVRSGVAQYTSGTATDYLSNEPDSVLNSWADVKTNASGGQSFAYGSAPGDGADIAFLGDNLQTYTDFSAVFTNTDGDDNLRLWDSADNAASGFVSNVTLPSPDLAGRNRGSSPFDPGPYEITAGSVGPIDTRPTFKIVRVNMYN